MGAREEKVDKELGGSCFEGKRHREEEKTRDGD